MNPKSLYETRDLRKDTQQLCKTKKVQALKFIYKVKGIKVGMTCWRLRTLELWELTLEIYRTQHLKLRNLDLKTNNKITEMLGMRY